MKYNLKSREFDEHERFEEEEVKTIEQACQKIQEIYKDGNIEVVVIRRVVE